MSIAPSETPSSPPIEAPTTQPSMHPATEAPSTTPSLSPSSDPTETPSIAPSEHCFSMIMKCQSNRTDELQAKGEYWKYQFFVSFLYEKCIQVNQKP